MTQTKIAAVYGVSQATISKWKTDYKIQASHQPSVDRLPNPVVECACGCGATFKKYRIRAARDGKGRERVARRFLPSHAAGCDPESKRLRIAERWAKRHGDKTGNYPESMLSGLKWSLDFSNEHLGEAWLATVEGDHPDERLREERRLENRHRRCFSLDLDRLVITED